MREAVEKGRRHFGVTEDGRPFAEAQVGGDDDAGALVEFTQEMEEQCAAAGAERQVAQLIQDGRRSGIDPGDQFPEDGGRAWSLLRRSGGLCPWSSLVRGR